MSDTEQPTEEQNDQVEVVEKKLLGNLRIGALL